MSDHTEGTTGLGRSRTKVGNLIGPWSNLFSTSVLAELRPWLSAMSLSTRFVVASFFVVCTAMFLTGTWVDSRIKKSVLRNASQSSARIVESTMNKDLQDLAEQRVVNDIAKATAKGLTDDFAYGRKITQIKIWLPDGTVAYTTAGTQIGEKPPLSAKLAGALRGSITADFENVDDVESEPERKAGVPLIEIYTPIRKRGSDRVIAVVEIYEDATELKSEFASARYQSWLVIGLLTVGMLSLLFTIVHWGTRLINDQRRALEATIGELSGLLQQNEDLRMRIMRTGQDNADLSDRLLRRVGADLHDGPAQLLGLSLLRLHELVPAPSNLPSQAEPTGSEALRTIRSSLQEALAEIRNISSGVSLPELAQRSVGEVIELAVGNHERRTCTKVRRDFARLPEEATQAAKTCLFRAVQEVLNNAFRHAGATGQFVHAWSDDQAIHMEVGDSGPGIDSAQSHAKFEGLGLVGLRHRTELLGGQFEIRTEKGKGTVISISIPQENEND